LTGAAFNGQCSSDGQIEELFAAAVSAAGQEQPGHQSSSSASRPALSAGALRVLSGVRVRSGKGGQQKAAQGSGWRTVLLPPAAAGDAWAGAAVHVLLLDAGAGAQAALAAARALQQAAGWRGGSATDGRAAEPAGLVVACVGRAGGGGGASSGSVVGGAAGAGVEWWADACEQLRQELQRAGAAQVVEEPLLLLAPADGVGAEVEIAGPEKVRAAQRLCSAGNAEAVAEELCATQSLSSAGNAEAAVAQEARAPQSLVEGGLAAGVAALAGALRAAVEERDERLAKRAVLAAA
jgi:hypothetical protein